MAVQRFSHQREEIYQAVCATKEHPSAQMVYDTLKPRMPKLSLGTVYRNLHQMAQEGRLLELAGPVARFDATTNLHTHIFCRECGQVADVDLPYDSTLDRRAAEEGWAIDGHHLMFHGICPVCAGNNKKSQLEV